MKTSQTGIDLIKSFEGFSPVMYLCPAGKPTVGYGHVILSSEKNLSCSKITSEQADELLKADLVSREDCVNRLVKVTISQEKFDALVSFVYNLGEANFARSTLLKKINLKDFTGAADEFVRWNKSTVNGKLVELSGLTRRRLAEKQLFLSK